MSASPAGERCMRDGVGVGRFWAGILLERIGHWVVDETTETRGAGLLPLLYSNLCWLVLRSLSPLKEGGEERREVRAAGFL